MHIFKFSPDWSLGQLGNTTTQRRHSCQLCPGWCKVSPFSLVSARYATSKTRALRVKAPGAGNKMLRKVIPQRCLCQEVTKTFAEISQGDLLFSIFTTELAHDAFPLNEGSIPKQQLWACDVTSKGDLSPCFSLGPAVVLDSSCWLLVLTYLGSSLLVSPYDFLPMCHMVLVRS